MLSNFLWSGLLYSKRGNFSSIFHQVHINNVTLHNPVFTFTENNITYKKWSLNLKSKSYLQSLFDEVVNKIQELCLVWGGLGARCSAEMPLLPYCISTSECKFKNIKLEKIFSKIKWILQFLVAKIHTEEKTWIHRSFFILLYWKMKMNDFTALLFPTQKVYYILLHNFTISVQNQITAQSSQLMLSSAVENVQQKGLDGWKSELFSCSPRTGQIPVLV